jgi:hypothetical protein
LADAAPVPIGHRPYADAWHGAGSFGRGLCSSATPGMASGPFRRRRRLIPTPGAAPGSFGRDVRHIPTPVAAPG